MATTGFLKHHLMDKILIIGAAGQLGSELTRALSDQFGGDQVIATDLRAAASTQFPYCRFEVLDVMDKDALGTLVKKERVTQIYHLAAVLSATGEKRAGDSNLPPGCGAFRYRRKKSTICLATQHGQPALCVGTCKRMWAG